MSRVVFVTFLVLLVGTDALPVDLDDNGQAANSNKVVAVAGTAGGRPIYNPNFGGFRYGVEPFLPYAQGYGLRRFLPFGLGYGGYLDENQIDDLNGGNLGDVDGQDEEDLKTGHHIRVVKIPADVLNKLIKDKGESSVIDTKKRPWRILAGERPWDWRDRIQGDRYDIRGSRWRDNAVDGY